MPSLRKVVEHVEYNTLPSPMKPEFAVASARENNRLVKKLKTDASISILEATAATKDGSTKVAKANEGRIANGHVARDTLNTTETTSGDASKQPNETIDLTSDEEDISLDNLAELKHNVAPKTGEANREGGNNTIGQSTTKIWGAVGSSVVHMRESLARANEATKETNISGTAKIKGKTIVINGTNNNNAATTKASGECVKKSVKLPTATNWNQFIDAPQPQYPYSSNPMVRKNANEILGNMRVSLQQTLPQPMMIQYPVGPSATTSGLGLERWSEHRIDSATTIDELEAMRNRLITLTKRTEVRLKEMNFLKAVSMIETKDNEERETTKEVIQKLMQRAESNISVDKNIREDGDRKNMRTTKKHGDSNDNSISEKRQRSTCCPFCLNTPTPLETDETYTCSVCEERTNVCLQCRGVCGKCRRVICEDCLMRCSTCFSDTYCIDCLPNSGLCTKCSKRKPKDLVPDSTTHRPVSLKKIPVTAQPQPVANTPVYSLHRFIVTEKNTLGLLVGENKNGHVLARHVHQGSYAELLGIKIDDEVCFAFSNGIYAKKSYATFVEGATCRPMMFEVKRKVSNLTNKVLHRFYISYEGSLGMTIKQVDVANGGNYTFIVNVQPGKLASLYGLCAGDIICKPSCHETFGGVYPWFLERIKQRPFTFAVLRSPSICPGTNPGAVLGLKRTNNPFVWSYGGDESICI